MAKFVLPHSCSNRGADKIVKLCKEKISENEKHISSK